MSHLPSANHDAERQELNALMSRLAEGDRSALAPLYERLWVKVSRFCTGLLANAAEGEDLAQQALLKLMGQAAAYDRERDALSWAFAIAAWECRSVLRRDRRRRELLAENGALLQQQTEQPWYEDTSHAALERKQLREKLHALMQALPESERLSVEAILTGHETPTGATWRKRKQRALARLRTLWRQADDQAEDIEDRGIS